MKTWLEINKKNLIDNLKTIKNLSKDKKIIAVVKANAYGLGVLDISKILLENGINFFGVANLEEAIELRRNGIECDILILGVLFEDEIDEAHKNNFHITITSREQLEIIKRKKIKPLVHIKIDTGMTRLGFDLDEVESIIEFCKKNSIDIKGIFSHFSDADGLSVEAENYTLSQIEKFKKVLDLYNFEYIHISNSAGLTRFSDKIVGNFIRVGIAMYGFTGNRKDKLLKNVFTLKTKVIYTKKVKEDTYISYGRHYKLKKDEKYAVIALGYADGLRKYLSNNSYVLIKNKKCEIIGNICMDMTIIKIPEAIDINVADDVVVLNDKIIEDIKINNFCIWEIMTGIGKRVKRIIV